ncbi:MAG TPA: hypothetical protein VF208_03420 [Candidatus Binatia bacterium]
MSRTKLKKCSGGGVALTPALLATMSTALRWASSVKLPSAVSAGRAAS